MGIIIVIHFNTHNKEESFSSSYFLAYPHESLTAGRRDAGRELTHWGGRLGHTLKIFLLLFFFSK